MAPTQASKICSGRFGFPCGRFLSWTSPTTGVQSGHGGLYRACPAASR
jgi:hypothetical protein